MDSQISKRKERKKDKEAYRKIIFMNEIIYRVKRVVLPKS